MFADTSIVPSSEPCLVCKCSKRNLVCVRRVCKDQVWCELKLNGRKRARAVKSKRNEKKVVGTSFSTSRSLHLSSSYTRLKMHNFISLAYSLIHRLEVAYSFRKSRNAVHISHVPSTMLTFTRTLRRVTSMFTTIIKSRMRKHSKSILEQMMMMSTTMM